MHTFMVPSQANAYHLRLSNMKVMGNEKKFTVSPYNEKLFRVALLESSWMLENITMIDVIEMSGPAYNIGGSGLFTGRELTGRFNQKLPVKGTSYSLVETDSCASLDFDQLSIIANYGDRDHFDKTMDAFFNLAISLDILRIGFNGERIAYPTDPENNPKGQDVNLGWHALAKTFNDGSQIMSDPLTLGTGGNYLHLDALANKLITDKIPEAYREDPRLVVMVGAELAAAERLRLFNSADHPADQAAAQMLGSSVAGRFAFVPPFMPGKRLAVTTLDNLHVYTQANTRYFGSEFVEDRKVYDRSYLRNEGYALGNGELYAAVDESAITVIQ